MTETPVALVDSNVLLDVVTDDPQWAEWSIRQLDAAAIRGRIAINDIVYAELAIRYPTIEAVDAFVDGVNLAVEPTPRVALFVAGKAFQRYRALGGPRTHILPDFFIGAHAAVLGIPLLTRDPRRYRTYFPQVALVVP